MISKNVIDKLWKYCEEGASDHSHVYGYMSALEDFGFMSEEEATQFLDYYVWEDDQEAARRYLEERMI